MSIDAGEELSFINAPEWTTDFFSEADRQFSAGRNVQFDLSKVQELTIDGLVLLVGCIKNYGINRGHRIDIINPIAEVPRVMLRKFNVFKKVPEEMLADFSDIPINRVSNTIVANGVAKELTQAASVVLYGKDKRIKELYEVLIEVMANTNNHASDDDEPEPWYALSIFDVERKTFEFVFVDFGVGIFNSWPVKSYISRVPATLRSIFPIVGNVDRQIRLRQLDHLFSELAEGRIGSRTGLTERGKGLPLIIKHSSSNQFNRLVLITNDGFVDLKEREVSCLDGDFSGTLLYLKMEAV